MPLYTTEGSVHEIRSKKVKQWFAIAMLYKIKTSPLDVASNITTY